MDVFSLAERLRDPDPRVRVEALRILAMVEETRALEAIRWVFQNDPEPGVREVAQWAGHVIWLAQQRGHSTQQAMQDIFSRTLSPDHQALFLDALKIDLSRIDDPKIRQYAEEQDYRRQLADIMQERADEDLPVLPAPQDTSADIPTSLDDLLEAGLSSELLE